MHNFRHHKKLYPYLYIILGAFILYIVSTMFLPAYRVGDGMEYYGLYYAWKVSHTPWMTPQAFDAYQQFYASEVQHALPAEWLKNQFPSLHIGSTMDFNHFWFYSFLAFVCHQFFSLFGMDLSGHQSFIMLHCILLTMTCCLAYKFYRWQGLLVVLFMIFLSPVLWFINKVHTEFFTVMLTLSAVILIYSKNYLPSALLLAAASTQNISFAPIACIPILYRIFFERKKPYTAMDVIICVATAFLLVIHPIYYFFRYGVFTPQLLAGGASPGANLSTFYIWILDPDLGLLPNWPLGLLLLLGGLGLWVIKKEKRSNRLDKKWLIFFVFYFLFCAYAHSSTTNLNSGATRSLARYALWYLPLLFPFYYWLIASVNWKNTKIYFLAPFIIFFAVLSILKNNPGKNESYSTPSKISYFIQKYLPGLYNPPPEVFLERYSGLGETPAILDIKALIGPDCHKVLLMPGEKTSIISPPKCHLDTAALDSMTHKLQSEITKPTYSTLYKKEIKENPE